jgi:iron-sulfur cluster assembly protein
MNKQAITLCSKSISHFKSILKEDNKKYMFFGVKGGGCNGLRYHMFSTNDPKEKNDELIKIDDDLSIIVCGHSLFHILGTHILWEETVMSKGLTFINPNAKAKCGCGETFSS